MRRPWVVLAATLAVAGCGGSDGGKHRAVTVAPGHTLRVVADEYSFDPGKVTVQKAGQLTLTVRNKGSLAHDLRLRRGGRDTGGTPTFQGGQRTVRLKLRPGRYEFLCTVGDHAELGMRGTLNVR